MADRAPGVLAIAVWLAATVLPSAPPAAAQDRSLAAADADLRPLGAIGLDQALSAARRASSGSRDPVWLVYRVDSEPGMGSVCCYRTPCCDLEHDDGFVHDPRPELGSDPILVLLRLEDGAVRHLRAYGESCRLGFGGRVVLWAADVEVADSLALLGRWLAASGADPDARTARDRKLAGDALSVVAHHRGAAATDLLAGVAATTASTELARDAAFWLGVARGRAGYERLVELLASRQELAVRKGIVFALGQNPQPEAAGKLVALAREDRDPELRREALFWLGQKGSEHADLILEAALSEPDADVARHAVFVLSQLPEPDNVERLTRVLIQDERPELRKEALFWIGQSDSPEALDIVSRILNQ
jgi:hypothetical protein